MATKQILELMPKIMEEVGAIPKTHRSGEGFMYRSVNDVFEKLQPLLVKYGITLATNVRDLVVSQAIEPVPATATKAGRLIYRAALVLDVQLIAPDDSHVAFSGAGEGIHYITDKATYKAQSGAFKYAMFNGLCIPVAEADDPDAAGAPESPKAAAVDPLEMLKQAAQQTAAVNGHPASEPAPAVTQPVNGTANPPGMPTPPAAANMAGPSVPTQHARIVAMAQELKMPQEALKQNVAKRGKQRLAELTFGDCEEMTRGLYAKLCERKVQLSPKLREMLAHF